MKKLLNKIWDSAKKLTVSAVTNKRNVGIAIMLINQGIKAFFPEVMTPDQFEVIDAVGLTIGGIGLGHKGYRSNLKIK